MEGSLDITWRQTLSTGAGPSRLRITLAGTPPGHAHNVSAFIPPPKP